MNDRTSSVLPFQLDFEKKNVTKTTYKLTTKTTLNQVETTETKKKEVPIITAGSSEHKTIYCINEFYAAKEALKWTQGPTLFANIIDIFEDPDDKNFWDTACAADNSTSKETFMKHIKDFIQYKLSGNDRAYSQHKRFLLNIKKTKSLTVHQFVQLIHYHNTNILKWLPGAPQDEVDAKFSADEVKEIVINAMPFDWVDDFDLKYDLQAATTPQIIKFMEKKNTISNRNKKKNENKKDNNNNATDTDSNTDGNNNGNRRKKNRNRNGGRGNRNRGGGNNRGNNSNNNNNNRRIQTGDPCPLPGHTGHTWGECYQNANNPNRNRNGNNTRNQNNNNGNRDNHANDRNNNSSGNNNNPQDGDNHYCQVIDDIDEFNISDLFHVDCCVDCNYYNDDLQRFPPASHEVVEYEEIFQQERIEDDSTDRNIQSPSDMNKFHVSPAPPKDATGYVRLTKTKDHEDLAPTTVLVCNQINDGNKQRIYLKTLFDSGTTDNIISKDALPKGVAPLILDVPLTMRTAQGTYSCAHYCYLHNSMFPELSLTRKCKTIKCLIVDSKMGYQLILGRRYMKQIGIQMDFYELLYQLVWEGNVLPSSKFLQQQPVAPKSSIE